MAKPTKLGKRWRVRYLDENGVQRSGGLYSLYREADVKQRILESQVEEIKMGLRPPTPQSRDFCTLCDYWVEKVLPQKRHHGADLSIIRKHLRPSFGKLKLEEIGREKIDAYRAERNYLDPKTIANQLTLLISMLNVAVELNWLTKAPRIKKPRLRLFSSDYRFLKTDDECERFERASLDEGESVYALYMAALYTGLRAGELAGLQWRDIDFNTRLITVQRSFSGPTKSDEVRHVPIVDNLVPVLKSWKLRTGGVLVFPNEKNNMHQKSARIFQEILHRVLKKAGFPMLTVKNKQCHYIRFHDLRHTFASRWVMNGGDIFKLQKILGHKWSFAAELTPGFAGN